MNESAQVSIQTRCPRMTQHGHGDLKEPCSECYSVRVTSVRLPAWQPPERWKPGESRCSVCGEPCACAEPCRGSQFVTQPNRQPEDRSSSIGLDGADNRQLVADS